METIKARGWGYAPSDPIGRPVEGELLLPNDSLKDYRIKTKDGMIFRLGDARIIQMGMVELQLLDGTWTKDYHAVFNERIKACQ